MNYVCEIIIIIIIIILDLIGVCIEVGDVEVFGNAHSQTEMVKREIELIDMSMTTVSFVCIEFLKFN